MEKIEIYTDGGCDQNKTWQGAFGVVVVIGGIIEFEHGSETFEKTTNNRMELEAIIYALTICAEGDYDEPHIIYSDSKYCVNGVNSWMHNWERKGWKKKKGELKNIDLWKNIYNLYSSLRNKPSVQWIQGHNGNKFNERADELAKW